MILSLANFQTGMYVLPHAERAPNEADNTELINAYIDRYERELLEETLGVDLYQEILDNQEDYESAPDNVKNIVLGTTYNLSDKNVKWGGLSDMLTPYIFYRFLQDQTEIFGTFGMERPQGKNSKAVSSIPKATQAYRDFYDKYQGEDEYARVISTRTHFGFDYGGNIKSNRSLYQFLNDNDDVYEVQYFQIIENTNQFGI